MLGTSGYGWLLLDLFMVSLAEWLPSTLVLK